MQISRHFNHQFVQLVADRRVLIDVAVAAAFAVDSVIAVTAVAAVELAI